MSNILAKVEALASAIGNGAYLTASQANAHRAELAGLRTRIAADLNLPAPGTTTQASGATITHRPDVAYGTEHAQQAAMQGQADRGGYLPVQTVLQPGGAGGTMQAPAPERPAELAKVGAEIR